MEIKDEIKKHVALRDHYWSNAQKALKDKEYEKASEFIWGSLAQLLHGLALSKGVSLQNHGKLRSYAKEITRELDNEEIWKAFKGAEELHANFYRAFLEPYQIILSMELIKRGMEELIRRAETRL